MLFNKKTLIFIFISILSSASSASEVCGLKIKKIIANEGNNVLVVFKKNDDGHRYNPVFLSGQNMVSLGEKAYFLELDVCANFYEQSGPWRIVSLTLENNN